MPFGRLLPLSRRVSSSSCWVSRHFFLFAFAFLFMNPVFGHGAFYSVVMAFFLVAIPAYLGFLAVVTGKRSAYAQKKKLEEIVGYREFISKVEMDKLKMMIDSDPSLFYHVLSYAIVLGLEDVWAKKFAKIALAEPQWYVGNRPIRNALFYSALSHRMHTSVMEKKAVYAQAKKVGLVPQFTPHLGPVDSPVAVSAAEAVGHGNSPGNSKGLVQAFQGRLVPSGGYGHRK